MMVADCIYAAGDIAQFPLPLTSDRVSIGHWQIAHSHGRIAALNMMGKREKFNSIPFFWTVLFGKSLRYCGRYMKEGPFDTNLFVEKINKNRQGRKQGNGMGVLYLDAKLQQRMLVVVSCF